MDTPNTHSTPSAEEARLRAALHRWYKGDAGDEAVHPLVDPTNRLPGECFHAADARWKKALGLETAKV